jgi:hypothetical protein
MARDPGLDLPGGRHTWPGAAGLAGRAFTLRWPDLAFRQLSVGAAMPQLAEGSLTKTCQLEKSTAHSKGALNRTGEPTGSPLVPKFYI